MTESLGKKLQLITLQQQKKIWLKRIINQLPPFLWISAIILFLAGGIHQLIQPLDPLLITSIIIIPALMGFSWISIQLKPALQEAAVQADHRIKAHSLFISAWEITGSATLKNSTTRLLLKRAENALPDWTQKISKQSQTTMKISSLSAITVSLLGLFFLFQPSHNQTQQTPVTTSVTTPETVSKKQTTAHALAELLNQPLKKEPLKTALPVNSENQNKTSTQTEIDKILSTKPEIDKDSIVPEKTQASLNHKKIMSTDEPEPGMIKTESDNSETKKMADRSAGNESPKTTDLPTQQADKFNQNQFINIETESDNSIIASDDSTEGDQLIISKPQQIAAVQSAKAQPQKDMTESLTLLSAQQRNLVRRYFTQLEKNNDSQ